jgi:hypothetical protein
MIYSYKGSFPQGESVVGKASVALTDARRGGSEMQLVFSGALRASYIGRLMENSGAGRNKPATGAVMMPRVPCEV